MAKFYKDSGGIRIIDPNPDNEIPNHEDLFTYVKLVAKTKNRSIIDQTTNTIAIEQEIRGNNENTNYIYNKNRQMDTGWTNIGGTRLENGKDVGGFGITGIDIDIKSSFVPQVTINFVDIRGAALFEQGPCSVYASFFHMPYPVFELTVKGYYGRPVTYILALKQFNTKFNSSTGNFEITAEFIGYTYAFLADLAIGFAFAANKMTGADGFKGDIWNKTREIAKELPSEFISLRDLVTDANKIESILSEISNSDEVHKLEELNKLKTRVDGLKTILSDYKQSLTDSGTPPTVSTSVGYNRDTDNSYLKWYDNSLGSGLSLVSDKVKKIREVTNTYFNYSPPATYGQYVLEVIGINTECETLGIVSRLTTVSQTFINNPTIQSNVTNDVTPLKDTGGEYLYIDLGFLIKENETFKSKLDQEISDLTKDISAISTDIVTDKLGYTPTVKNVHAIILANMELFLKLFLDASYKADTGGHKDDTSNLSKNGGNGVENLVVTGGNKVYPWPIYSESGKEKYPGANPNLRYWEEVKFVEDFINAYFVDQAESLAAEGETENLLGYDNFLPLSPLETGLFGDPVPNSYHTLSQKEEIYKTILNRAFLVGDYTNVNPLSIYTSRSILGEPTSRTNKINDFKTSLINYGILATPKVIDSKMMYKYGFLDGVNASYTLNNDSVRQVLYTKTVDDIKNGVKNGLSTTTINSWANKNSLTYGMSDSDTVKVLNGLVNGNTSHTGYQGGTKIHQIPNISLNNFNVGGKYDQNDCFKILDSDVDTSINLPDNSDFDEVKNKLFYAEVDGSFKKVTNVAAIKWFPSVLIQKTGTDIDGIDDTKPVFNLDEKHKIPHVPTDYSKYFIKPETVKSMGKVLKTTSSTTVYDDLTITVSGSTSSGDKTTYKYPTINMTKTWTLNQPSGQQIFLGSIKNPYKYKTINGEQPNNNDSLLALAYLALITISNPGNHNQDIKEGSGFGFWGLYPEQIPNNSNYGYMDVTPFFKTTGSKIYVPKGFIYLTGAVLWRLEEFEKTGNDPVKWDSKYKTLSPSGWPHVYDFNLDKRVSNTFLFINQGVPKLDYPDINNTLRLLPDKVKSEFINKFKSWVNGDWKNKYIKEYDPLNWGSKNSLKDSYIEDGDHVYINENNATLKTMYEELVTKHHIVVNTTPLNFYAFKKEDIMSRSFNLTSDELDAFIDGWKEGFNKTFTSGDEVVAENSENIGGISLNDEDIKLSLYKSFKSIYDKWVSNSNVTGTNGFDMFYNTKTTKDKILLSQFNFIDRTFRDIGDESVLDITYIKNMDDDVTTSLYQTITELLSKNNFDFFPLPSFINYQSVDSKEILQMFQPVTEFGDINTSPSFICMYIGGVSKSLDITTNGNSFCDNSGPYRYDDDGMFFPSDKTTSTSPTKMGEDFNSVGTNKVTGFIVSYGSENQSHFTSVNLDQAEFKNTNEALLVIDQIAKTRGTENNRVSKGQNLFNIYQTRSYTCEVEGLGNMMIQPLMYFQLTNVPMFRGSYLILDVKHTIKPHHVTTSFKGVRVPRVVTPVVTEPYANMITYGDEYSGSIYDITPVGTRLPSDEITKGVEIAQKLVTDLGINKAVAAGIVGNLVKESHLKPDIIQGGRRGLIKDAKNSRGQLGYGWAQWTSSNLKKDFIDHVKREFSVDLNTTKATDEHNLSYLKAWITSNAYKDDYKELKNKRTANQASQVFAKKYEKCAECTTRKELAERASYAEQIFDAIP